MIQPVLNSLSSDYVPGVVLDPVALTVNKLDKNPYFRGRDRQ